MNTGDIRVRGAPYYACYVAQQMAKHSATTKTALISESRITLLLSGEITTDDLLKDDRTLTLALELLESSGVIQFIRDEFGPDLIVRSPEFSDRLKGLHNSSGSAFNKFQLAGDERNTWLQSAILEINARLDALGEDAVASGLAGDSEEDRWEPLPIERDNPDFRTAIDSTERAVDAIEQNNGYATSEPEERDGIVRTLRGALEALRSASASRGVVVEGLVKPLK